MSSVAEQGQKKQNSGERKAPESKGRGDRAQALGAQSYAQGGAATSLSGGHAAVEPHSIPVPDFLTRGFDVDLSGVQIHYGTGLPDAAGAQAYAEGQDIYVANDAPDIGSTTGKRLIGHELAHVVQQIQGASDDDRTGSAGGANSGHEGEAEAAGEAVASGGTAAVSGASEPGAAQHRTGSGPSSKAIENAKARNTGSGVNRTGNFNVAGKSTGNDYQFVQRGGKYYVRAKPQVTKDRNTVTNAGGDADSTEDRKGTDVQAELKLDIAKGEKHKSVLETKTGGETLAEGGAGTLVGEGHVGKASVGGEIGGAVNKDGVEVKAGANVGISLAGGKLCWTLPTAKFDILGEQLEAKFGVELSAEVAASAKGEVGLSAGKTSKGVKVGASAGGEAFAGAKAGFKLFGKGVWNTKKGEEDVLGAFAGVEGWAGAAAAAKFNAHLIPSVKFEGYLGAAVGIGASAKVGVEAQVVNIARLGYILAKRGIPAAWRGLEKYGTQVGEWLLAGAAELYDVGAMYMDSVSTSLLGDANTIKMIERGGHKHMNSRDRGALITKLIAGTCFDAEEDAVLSVLRYSKEKGDHWVVAHWTEGGLSAIQWALDGAQDTTLGKIMS